MANKKGSYQKNGRSGIDVTRNNHYVPQWYQKGFTLDSNEL